MVYKIEDINHLEAMASLSENKVKKVSAKEILSSVLVSESKEELTEKILKLCNNLRTKGFGKYADSVERKFLIYKLAKTHLYRTHNEDGEDLVNEAHPDGDVHIADATDNNGEIHTSVSKHKKIVDIINKTPTGKLASYIRSCKIALADETLESIPAPAGEVEAPQINSQNIESAKNLALTSIKYIQDVITNFLSLTPEDPGLRQTRAFLKSYRDSGLVNMQKFINQDPSLKNLDKLKQVFEQIRDRSFAEATNIAENAKAKYIAYCNYAISLVYTAIAYLKGDATGVQWHKEHYPSDTIATAFKKASDDLQNTLLSKQTTNDSEQRKNVLNEISRYKQAYDAIRSRLNSSSKNMHISDITKFPEWASSPFKDANISSMKDLIAMLGSEKSEMSNILSKYK